MMRNNKKRRCAFYYEYHFVFHPPALYYEQILHIHFIVNDFTGEALDFLKDIIVILVIVLVMRTFLIMPFKINGQSMYESYYDREFIIVDRFSYLDLPIFGQTQEVERGDVIVFAPGVSEERKYFIKRVIALPGETLKIE